MGKNILDNKKRVEIKIVFLLRGLFNSCYEDC